MAPAASGGITIHLVFSPMKMANRTWGRSSIVSTNHGRRSIKLAKSQEERESRPGREEKDALFLGVPGWLDEGASAASFSSATAACPLPTRWDLPVDIWLFPTSGQLSASVSADECCGDRGSSFRDEGVVPVLDPGVDDDAPLRLDDDVVWVDCTLAEPKGSGCREPEDVADESQGGDVARGTCDGAV